jgi:chaperonin GroES
MKFTPRLDFVLVQMDAPEEKSDRGILLPDSAKEDRARATVISVGPGRMTEMGILITVEDLKKGDRIFFNKFAATELDEDERLYVVRGNDIVCKSND